MPLNNDGPLEHVTLRLQNDGLFGTVSMKLRQLPMTDTWDERYTYICFLLIFTIKIQPSFMYR